MDAACLLLVRAGMALAQPLDACGADLEPSFPKELVDRRTEALQDERCPWRAVHND